MENIRGNDVKMVIKGEDDIKVANGEMVSSTSIHTFVANSTYIFTSLTLVSLESISILPFSNHYKCDNRRVFWSQVLEFQKGRLQNLYWKRDGCSSCSGKSNFVCLNNEDCAIRTNSCKNRGGNVDCSLGIQLAFSGTDKRESVFNSWYEVKNLRQYSLFRLYKSIKDSLTSQYNSFF